MTRKECFVAYAYSFMLRSILLAYIGQNGRKSVTMMPTLSDLQMRILTEEV